MITSEKITEKRIYSSPEIVCLELDYEISLVLESSPPEGPGEYTTLSPEYFNNNQFMTNLI